jgi:hypothetical protein
MAVAFLSAQRSKDPNRQVSLEGLLSCTLGASKILAKNLDSIPQVDLRSVSAMSPCLVSGYRFLERTRTNYLKRQVPFDPLKWTLRASYVLEKYTI